MLLIAGLLLVSFALLVFSRIAETRWMGIFLEVLGMVACSVAAFHVWKDHSTFKAILGFLIVSSAISELIAIPVRRRRVVRPCVRVREPRSRIPGIIKLVVLIAFVTFFLVTGGLYEAFVLLGLGSVWAVRSPVLIGKTEICGNGVWQSGTLLLWKDYTSFSWDREADESIELRLMPRSPTWEGDLKRLTVLPGDREVVQHLLEANLPEVSV